MINQDILVEKGVMRERGKMEYPLDDASRHFSYDHYDRKWQVKLATLCIEKKLLIDIDIDPIIYK